MIKNIMVSVILLSTVSYANAEKYHFDDVSPEICKEELNDNLVEITSKHIDFWETKWAKIS